MPRYLYEESPVSGQGSDFPGRIGAAENLIAKSKHEPKEPGIFSDRWYEKAKKDYKEIMERCKRTRR